MAVPSLRNRSNANKWAAINKQRAEASKPQQEERKEEPQLTPEEHEARVKMLKQLGILKE